MEAVWLRPPVCLSLCNLLPQAPEASVCTAQAQTLGFKDKADFLLIKDFGKIKDTQPRPKSKLQSKDHSATFHFLFFYFFFVTSPVFLNMQTGKNNNLQPLVLPGSGFVPVCPHFLCSPTSQHLSLSHRYKPPHPPPCPQPGQ